MWVDYKELLPIIPQRTLFRMIASRRVESRTNGRARQGKPVREVNVLSLPVETQAEVLRLLNGDGGSGFNGSGAPELAQVPDHHLEKALERIAACREALEAPRGRKTEVVASIAERLGITPQQLYRDIKKFKRSGKDGKNLLAAMLPRWSGPGKAETLRDEIEARVKAEYLMPTRPSVAKIHRAIVKECEARGEAAPGYATVRRIVAEIPEAAKVRHRKGKETWRKTVMPKVARDYEPLRPNELWCGDHHQFDLFIRHKGRLVRPWVTAWMDLKTRAVVGLNVNLQPNSWTIALALRHGILPKPEGDAYPMRGAPERVYIDNGKDYLSHHLGGASKRFKVDFNQETKGALEAIGVQQVTHAKPYTPWSKTVERFFGTMERDLVQDLPGWCGNKPEARPEKLQRELAGARLLSVEELKSTLIAWLMNEYHARPHSGQGMGGRNPMEVWLGTERVVKEFDPKALDLLLMKVKSRVIRADGVYFNGHRYWADDLALHVGERVNLRFSPDEMGRILVFRRKKLLCEAFADKLYTFNASEADLRAIQARQRKAERLAREYREEAAARAAEPDPVERYFEEAAKTEAAIERLEVKETKLRMLTEFESAARELEKPKRRRERRLKVWDDEIEELSA